jgi:hypothetical protein
VAAVTLDADGRVETASNLAIAGLLPILAEMPAEPCVAQHTFILEATQEQYTCTVNLVYQLVRGYQPGPTTIPGLITSENEGILSQHWYLTPLEGTHALGAGNGMVAVTVGTLGTTLTLPDPTALDTPTHITMYIVDSGAGYLTVLPFGTEEIGDYGNTSPPPITGKGSKYEFSLVAGNWHLVTTTALKLAQLGGQTLCVGTGGSVDNAATNVNTDFFHTITCDITPELGLKQGDVLQACVGYAMVTGSVSPQLLLGLRIGTVDVAETNEATPPTNVPNISLSMCWHITLGADPVAATPLYVTQPGLLSFLDSTTDGNNVAQPQNVDLTVTKTLAFYSHWDAAGTGTCTLTQLSAWVTLFRK